MKTLAEIEAMVAQARSHAATTMDFKLIGICGELLKRLTDNIMEARNGRPHRSSPPFDYEMWDWTKRNLELSLEHGVSSHTVTKMRHKLGKPKVFKYSCIDTTGWDRKLSDSILGRKNKLSIFAVKWLRSRDKAPASTVRDGAPNWYNHKVPKVDWEKLDWNTPDSVLARKVNRTREMVRQMRVKLGKPRRTKGMLQYEKFIASLNGAKTATVADFRKCKICNETGRRYLVRAGIEFVRLQSINMHERWKLMNWDIPNPALAAIWQCSVPSVTNYRCREGIRRSAFRISKLGVHEEKLPLLQREEGNANAYFLSKDPQFKRDPIMWKLFVRKIYVPTGRHTDVGRPRKYDYETWDWSKADGELSMQYGIAKGNVKRSRLLYGPQPKPVAVACENGAKEMAVA